MSKHEIKILFVAVVIVIIGSAAVLFVFSSQNVANNMFTTEQSASDETPYGESLHIHLAINGKGVKGTAIINPTNQVNIMATSSDSNDLYNVTGTLNGGNFDHIADLMQITVTISITVTGSNVQNVQLTSLYVKTQDKDGSGTHTYTSVSSPTSVTLGTQYDYTPLNAYSIATLLSDNGANTNGDELTFKVYAKVTAVGSTSGKTLTAELPETQFADLTFTKQTEEATSNVSPSVSVSSWYDIPIQITINVVSAVVSAILVWYILQRHYKKDRKARRVRK